MNSEGGKGEGRDPRAKRGPGDEDERKVIRLPRDWLGPREELVPFGPSAERGRDEPGESEPSPEERKPPDDDPSARPPLEEVSPPPAPVSPDDFWGERSAALQRPLDEADRDVAQEDDSRPSLRLRRTPVLAAAAAAVAASVILSLSVFGQSSGPGKSRVSAGVDRSSGRGTLWPSPPHLSPAGHSVGLSGHGRSRSRRRSLDHSGAMVAVDYVREPSSSQTAATGGGSTAGTGSTSAPSGTNPTSGIGTPTPSSPAPSSSSGSSHHSKAPAFGARGALGPGHSRTG